MNSAPAGRETIKFVKSGAEPKRGNSKKTIQSGAEMRVLGTNRPLTSNKVVTQAFIDKSPPTKKQTKQDAESVIERYHDFYGQTSEDNKNRSQTKRASDPSLDSDNFSMCSDVIRHMNTHGDHYVPDGDEDHYV